LIGPEVDQLTLSYLCLLASTYFYLTYLWNFLIFFLLNFAFALFFLAFCFFSKKLRKCKKRTEVLTVNLKPFSRTACLRGAVCPLCFCFWRGRGAVCPLCFFFGEGGLCALLFLVYEYHQGATSNLQDRNRDMAIAILQWYTRGHASILLHVVSVKNCLGERWKRNASHERVDCSLSGRRAAERGGDSGEPGDAFSSLASKDQCRSFWRNSKAGRS
jgi:hypothetical protein